MTVIATCKTQLGKAAAKMTEYSSARFTDLDTWPTAEALEAMYEGQLDALAALRTHIAIMAEACDAAALRLRKRGRLVYVGAGTSGRLAVLDGVELGPTYGWPNERLLFCIAGGTDALTQSVEGAEDAVDEGAARLRRESVGSDDVVIALAASGETPFTLGALKQARALGAMTIGIVNSADTAILNSADFGILAETGSETVAGSTRMKAGTAQKAILSMLSTAIMLRLDRVYEGLMVNMVVSNIKLERRAVKMISAIADCDDSKASDALAQADRDIKTAVLICLGNTLETSRTILNNVDGSLRKALADIDHTSLS